MRIIILLAFMLCGLQQSTFAQAQTTAKPSIYAGAALVSGITINPDTIIAWTNPSINLGIAYKKWYQEVGITSYSLYIMSKYNFTPKIGIVGQVSYYYHTYQYNIWSSVEYAISISSSYNCYIGAGMGYTKGASYAPNISTYLVIPLSVKLSK